MNKIKLQKKNFYADYFWSLSDGGEVKEDVLVKTYLSNFFTFKDLFYLYHLVGKDKLLTYAKDVGNYKRIKHLVDILERYK